MTRRLPLRLLACGLAAAVLLAPVVLIPSQIVDLFRPTNQGFYPLTAPMGQTFVSPTDRLSSVGLFVATTPGQFPGRAEATLTLTRADTGEVVRTVRRTIEPGARLPSNLFTPTYFDFPPVEGSRGVTYRATLAAGPGLALIGSRASAYPDGSAWVGGQAAPFDLSLATRHHGTLGERLRRLSHWAPLWLVLAAAVTALAAALALVGVTAGLPDGQGSDDPLLPLPPAATR